MRPVHSKTRSHILETLQANNNESQRSALLRALFPTLEPKVTVIERLYRCILHTSNSLQKASKHSKMLKNFVKTSRNELQC